MPSVAVISEFNPFHNGHARLLRKIRESLGRDAFVTAIMSGSFVQRGDLALASPYLRAESAVRSGFDLVLELPFPFCASNAGRFADSGVSLASSLGCIDTLSFGCECGDLTVLNRIADIADSPAANAAFAASRETDDGKRKGYAALRREILGSFLPESDAGCLQSPNNILALEYLRANRKLPSPLSVLPVLRVGTGYHDDTSSHPVYSGATALRALLLSGEVAKTENYIPAEAYFLLKNAFEEHSAPARLSQLSDAVLAFLIAKSGSDLPETAEGTGGLLRRILSFAGESHDLDELIRRVSARSFTDSHVRRAVLFACLGVTSSELDEKPAYTRVLGMNDRGRELLRAIKRKASVALLTKTADYPALPPDAKRQAERSLGADRFYGLALPDRRPANDAYRGVPCHIPGAYRE